MRTIKRQTFQIGTRQRSITSSAWEEEAEGEESVAMNPTKTECNWRTWYVSENKSDIKRRISSSVTRSEINNLTNNINEQKSKKRIQTEENDIYITAHHNNIYKKTNPKE